MKCMNCEIHVERSFLGLGEALSSAGLSNRLICIVTDDNVGSLYLDEAQKSLDAFGFRHASFAVSHGEENKNLDVVQSIYSAFIKAGMDRRSVVLTLGGGVVGDMAGFAAATYMRGIAFAQSPTTLLSQVDASVGGKVGVDFMGIKNMVGAFYQPACVYINTSALKTLPDGQFASGMAEVIKHGLILDKPYYDRIKILKERISSQEPGAIKEIIEGSCRIKASVVSQDEKEKGLREILNYGHTFGHAVESLSGFSLLHGHSVAIGIAAALHMSENRGYLKLQEVDDALCLLKYFKLPIKASGFSAEDVYEQMKLDKKSRDGKMNFVLLKGIGQAYREENASRDEIFEAIRYIL
ncbi:MAG: 3-dehydroquinate synthase [Clostridiales bacterium]|nr:3-dehydroquinate synthase [Clostridiales bacterium]